MNTRDYRLRIAAAVVLVAACVGVYVSPLRNWLTVENLSTLLKALQAAWYTPILFIVGFSIGCVLFFPATVFLVTAGVIWGGWPGSLYAFVGAVLGSFIAFEVSKFIGGDILRRLGKRGEQLARILEKADFSALLMLRLIPFFPFPVFNYGAGVAGVRIRDFILSTAIGIAPMVVVVTYSAEALFSGLLSKEDAFMRVAVVGCSLLALVGIPLLFRKRAARALHLDETIAEGEIE